MCLCNVTTLLSCKGCQSSLLCLTTPLSSKVTLFHTHVCEAIPEDYLLELADWTYRKLTYLNSKEVASFADTKGECGGGRGLWDPPCRDEPPN